MTFASGLKTGHQAGAHRLARYRSEFPIFRDRIYLNTCSLGALGERARNKVVEFLDLWQARGASAWYDVWWAALSELRARYAGVIGAAPEAIALAPSISVALFTLAESLDYARRPKVVVTRVVEREPRPGLRAGRGDRPRRGRAYRAGRDLAR